MTTVPAIGICASVEKVSFGVWHDYEVALSGRKYVQAVHEAGGIAFVLPPGEAVVESPDLILDRIDGLILGGGADIDPGTYGAEPHPATGSTWPDRDRFEVALTRRAIERDVPVLGICRGMQLMNVALGGSLDQHLPDSGNEVHRAVAGTFGEHHVRLEPDSLACTAAEMEAFVVYSHHHQGVERVGEGLRVSGWSDEDDLVEAIELPDQRFALGVVWHPEEDPQSRVIASLVEAARGAVPSARVTDMRNSSA